LEDLIFRIRIYGFTYVEWHEMPQNVVSLLKLKKGLTMVVRDP